MPILIKTHHLIEYVHNIRYSTTDNIMLSYFVVFVVYAYHQVLLCQSTLILFCSCVSGIVIDCNMCSCCICWTFSSSSSKLRESISHVMKKVWFLLLIPGSWWAERKKSLVSTARACANYSLLNTCSSNQSHGCVLHTV